jgi:hypothetical protein
MKSLTLHLLVTCFAATGFADISLAGETTATMEKMKGEAKALTEETKGQAKGAVEDAKGKANEMKEKVK